MSPPGSSEHLYRELYSLQLVTIHIATCESTPITQRTTIKDGLTSLKIIFKNADLPKQQLLHQMGARQNPIRLDV